MSKWIVAAGFLAMQIVPLAAMAQNSYTPEEKAAARAQRRAQGTEATREFHSGEGNPIPDARPKVSSADRAAARAARRIEGAQAAREFHPGEGDPKPEARAEVPRSQRVAANAARRAEIRRANKAGEIPSYNDAYGGK